MLIRGLAGVVALALAGPASAEVKSVSANGLEVAAPAGLEQWAPKVDRVLDEQLQRLKSFVEGKPPPQ